MMPVLNKNTADALLREMTDGKAESEKIRLSDLLAKMQAAITHLALLSDFDMLRKLLDRAGVAHANLQALPVPRGANHGKPNHHSVLAAQKALCAAHVIMTSS